MRFIASFAIAVILLLAISSPVLAAIDHPDSTPSITHTAANRHLIEDDDMLVYAKYNIPYAATPDEPITDTFVFRLIDTDNVTELGSIEAYPYVENGYGFGIVAFYFTAADAPAWGGNYIIRVSEKPSAFPISPRDTDFVIDAADYSSLITQAGNQGELVAWVLARARELESAWNTTLLESTDAGGTVLSAGGEIYFRNSIFGLQVMASELFLVQVVNPEHEALDWDKTQAVTTETRLSGGTLGMGIRSVSDMFSVDFHAIAGMPILIACVLAIAAAAKMKAPIADGLICSIAICVCGYFMGWLPAALFTIGSIVCILVLVGVGITKLIPT